VQRGAPSNPETPFQKVKRVASNSANKIQQSVSNSANKLQHSVRSSAHKLQNKAGDLQQRWGGSYLKWLMPLLTAVLLGGLLLGAYTAVKGAPAWRT